MTRCLTATLTVLALMCTASLAHADAKEKAKAMRSPVDSKEFAMKAAEGGMLEVKLAQLAQQKSQAPEVKRLAQTLEKDHTMVNQELMAAAKQKNIDIPAEIKGECQETYEAFGMLEGKDFDNAYLLHNVKGHLKSVMMFTKEAENGTDADIKQWAAKTLPHLKRHTREISAVAQSAGLPIDAIAGTGAGGDARPAGSRIESGRRPSSEAGGSPNDSRPNPGDKQDRK